MGCPSSLYAVARSFDAFWADRKTYSEKMRVSIRKELHFCVDSEPAVASDSGKTVYLPVLCFRFS
jgi:hypothetical protein